MAQDDAEHAMQHGSENTVLSSFDPSREAAAMDNLDRRYLAAVPRQVPLEAHWIAYRAGDPNGSRRFSGFARRNAWMLQRLPSDDGPSWAYRLSADGALIADAIASAMSAQRAETQSGSGLQPASAVREAQTPKGPRP